MKIKNENQDVPQRINLTIDPEQFGVLNAHVLTNIIYQLLAKAPNCTFEQNS